jgi:hypothetical protein
MNKKLIFLSITLIAIIVIGGALWCIQKRPVAVNKPVVKTDVQQENVITEAVPDRQTFVTDVDPDVDHWQVKKAKAFSIKFPKEWYWMESNHGENEGYSEVITNNPDFDITKHAEIGIGAGGSYPLLLINDTEVVMTFSGVLVTPEVGTPRESIDWLMKSREEYTDKHANSDTHCGYVDNRKNVPPAAYCSFFDENHQRVQVYYVAYDNVTFGFRVWTSANNNTVGEDILEKIATSIDVVRNR